MRDIKLRYKAEPTPTRFHNNNAPRRGLIGPFRSGKSVACCQEIAKRMSEQRRDESGFRRSAWVVVRNSYRELLDSTIKTFHTWFPPDHIGRFNKHDMVQPVMYGDVRGEVRFRALDKPGDLGKVLSTEYTGAWINEAREVPKSIIDGVFARTGQYPSKNMGGCTWSGMIMDTNPPDTDHWWYKIFEEREYKGLSIPPDQWALFRQPGALIEIDGKFVPNPKAENIGNLNQGMDYYLTNMVGNTPDWIRVYYCGEYGFVLDGRPVIHEYVDSLHCSKEPIKPIEGATCYIGIDFGLTPAAIFMQQDVFGRYYWIDEFVSEDKIGVTEFAKLLAPKIKREWTDKGFKVEIYGDPAGNQESQTDKDTPFNILHKYDIPAIPAPVPDNDFTIRREAIAVPLTTLVEGEPQLTISPRCRIARKGMAGKYYFKRIQVTGDERYHNEPVKTAWSHAVEAGGYAMVGAGEGERVIGANRKPLKSIYLNNKRDVGPNYNVGQGWMRG